MPNYTPLAISYKFLLAENLVLALQLAIHHLENGLANEEFLILFSRFQALKHGNVDLETKLSETTKITGRALSLVRDYLDRDDLDLLNNKAYEILIRQGQNEVSADESKSEDGFLEGTIPKGTIFWLKNSTRINLLKNCRVLITPDSYMLLAKKHADVVLEGYDGSFCNDSFKTVRIMKHAIIYRTQEFPDKKTE